MKSFLKANLQRQLFLVKIQYFVLFVGVLFVCSQMSEPHSGLTLKCAKCGVVSTTALSATTASNAMLVPIIYIFLLQIFYSACEKMVLWKKNIMFANIGAKSILKYL